MTAMGLWRQLVDPGVHGSMPASYFNNGKKKQFRLCTGEVRLMTGNCHCDIDMDIPWVFVIINGPKVKLGKVQVGANIAQNHSSSP